MFGFTKKYTVVGEVVKVEKVKTVLSKDKIRQSWKDLSKNKQITREDMAALCIYRSMLKQQGVDGAKSRLLNSFKAITNKNKLANGVIPYGAMYSALLYIHLSQFFGWLSEEDQKIMQDMAKEIIKDRYK